MEGSTADRPVLRRTARDIAAHHGAILDAAFDCIITIDDHGRVLEFNRAAEATFGYSREEAVGRGIHELIVPPELRRAHRRGMARYRSTGVARILGRPIETRAMRRDGTTFPAELAVSRVELGGRTAFTAHLRDITTRRDAEQQLHDAKERYRALVESLPTVVYEADFGSDGAWRYVSPQIEALLGFPADAWLADPTLWFSRIHPDDRAQAMVQEQALRAKPPGEAVVAEYRMLTRSGRLLWIRDEAVVVPAGENAPTQMRGLIIDITERKRLEAKLSRHAFYDSLTGLPNRALFMERLERALAHRQRQTDGMTGVLFLDLDNFKVINDTLGHATGDSLLTTIASRLQAALRPMDTPARFGGDEFTVLLEALEGPAEALQIAARVAERLAEPLRLAGRELVTTVSIGIGIATDGFASADEVVSQADIAMYRAKENGKAQVQLFDAGMSRQAWQRLEMERELRRAIDAGELRLLYQPIVELATGAIRGVEALIRWHHPQRGVVEPAEFIPFAEQSGLITRLDAWVLRAATVQLGEWQRALPWLADLAIAVNLSPRHFRVPGVVETVDEALRASGIAPANLHLEITESAAMLDSELVPQLIAGLHRLGVKVLLDDFGVGYSGLDYVKRLHVDGLKIDRSFVAGLGVRREDTAIVSAAAAFARALDLPVVAEGIETEAQWNSLLAVGCQFGQGHLISVPLPPAELERVLGRVRADPKGGRAFGGQPRSISSVISTLSVG